MAADLRGKRGADDAPVQWHCTGSECRGKVLSNVVVWTGTNSLGEPATPPAGVNNIHCVDWSTTASTGWTGRANQSGFQWSSTDSQACTTYGHLYCFEQ
jgi:hypothetical protein